MECIEYTDDDLYDAALHVLNMWEIHAELGMMPESPNPVVEALNVIEFEACTEVLDSYMVYLAKVVGHDYAGLDAFERGGTYS